MDDKEIELFEKTPVTKAVMLLVVPTVISQLITVLYNMADTFFIGQTGDPNQIAAANLCMPMFFLLTGIANLFGIGGSSLISRSLGKGDKEKATRTSVFCVWTSIAVSLLYGVIVYVLCPVILPAFGANEDTYDFCRQYIFWTIAVRKRHCMGNPYSGLWRDGYFYSVLYSCMENTIWV
jgi:multidrug efflux pump